MIIQFMLTNLLVRHDESRLALMGTESLQSDLDSLGRMVTDFAKDHGVLDQAELDSLLAKVYQGDLTIVMQQYENSLKSPLKNAVLGSYYFLLILLYNFIKLIQVICCVPY